MYNHEVKMALIHRLFQHSREKKRCAWGSCAAKKEQNFESPEVLTSHKCWQAPALEKKQIRLLVFKECDVKGKKILIDSKAIHKVDQQAAETSPNRTSARYSQHVNSDAKTSSKPSSAPNIVDGYQFTRPGSDHKMLGEMLFGSIPMSSNGPIIKVHTFKMPPKLMLSRVFLLKPPKEHLETEGGDKDTISLCCADMTIPRSISANSLPSVEIARSLPIAMPGSPAGRGLDDESGEFSASGSFLAPFLPSSPGSSVSSSASNGSLHRRWLRNQVTSMEHVVRRRSSENINTTGDELIRPRKRYPKISVAVLFTLPEVPDGREDEEFRRFFFSHFSLIESHFQRLVSTIERTLIFQRKSFIRPIMEALEHFKLTVIQLYTAPRIQRPIWLNLMTYPQQRGHLCEHLIRELSRLLELHNSKQNNFFMSRLMTGVLMHHLAWVPTVMPAGATPSRAFHDKHSSTTLDMLAKCHPYNPLWAQLGDMYGNIGLPNRVAKTVIVGKQAEVVCKLLYVLSYFIRCSEVHEVDEKCEEIVMKHCSKFALSDSDEKLDRRRTLTEESVLAKTEDSGIEDVGLTQSESSGKPVFYIQDIGKCDDHSVTTETSSDDGVGFESEIPVGEVKRLRCIHESKISRTTVTSNVKESCAKIDFEDNDEVFKANSASESHQVSRTHIQLVNRTDPPAVGQTDVERKLTDQEDLSTDGSIVVCKALDNSMLVSKVEVVTPVGRASRNIEDLLRFDINESEIVQEPTKSNRMLGMCENPDLVDSTKCASSEPVCPVSDSVHHVTKSVENALKLDQEHVVDSCECNSRSSKVVSESIDIVTKQSHRVTETTVDTQTRDSTQRISNATNHLPTSSSHIRQDGDQNHHHISRLDSVERSRHCTHRDLPKKASDLYHRSVSSMSNVSAVSSTLSHMSDHTCLDHEELPLACSEQVFGLEMELDKVKSHVDNFGRSLLGGYSQQFVPDFALQGVASLDMKMVEKNLVDYAQHPVLDDSVVESVYVIADTDRWTVETVSSERFQGCGEKPNTQEVVISSLVDQLLDSVGQLHRMKLSSDFCLMHLEDRLQELYFQSTSVASYLEHKPMIKAQALAGSVGVDCTDLPLLLAVASVHSPHIIANVMRETIEQQRIVILQESP